MLALPATIHVWKPQDDISAPATFKASAASVMRDYLGAIADQPGGPRPESLELAISSWLGDLAGGIRKPVDSSEADAMLVTSGLYDRIKGGYLRTEFGS